MLTVLSCMALAWIYDESRDGSAERGNAQVAAVNTAPTPQPRSEAASAEHIASNTHTGIEQAPDSSADFFPVVNGKYAFRRLSDDYPKLAELARNGDRLAIEALLQGLVTCNPINREYSPDRAALDANIARLRNPEHILANVPLERDRAIRQLVQTYEHCGELTSEQLASQRTWTELGAELGVWSAIASYEHALMPDDAWRQGYDERLGAHHARVLQLYDQQIQLGNRTALLYRGLSMYGASGANRDSAGALAYFLAFHQVAPTADDMAERRIAELSLALSAEQRSHAQQRAEEIVGNCCSR